LGQVFDDLLEFFLSLLVIFQVLDAQHAGVGRCDADGWRASDGESFDGVPDGLDIFAVQMEFLFGQACLVQQPKVTGKAITDPLDIFKSPHCRHEDDPFFLLRDEENRWPVAVVSLVRIPANAMASAQGPGGFCTGRGLR